jgi:hypothetical protein
MVGRQRGHHLLSLAAASAGKGGTRSKLKGANGEVNRLQRLSGHPEGLFMKQTG